MASGLPLSRVTPAGTVPSVLKYWLKFSSPDTTVPHGVVPPEQLLSVPLIAAPVGSAVVLSSACPAAGPVTLKTVSALMRRFFFALPRFFSRNHEPATSPRLIVTTERPCE